MLMKAAAAAAAAAEENHNVAPAQRPLQFTGGGEGGGPRTEVVAQVSEEGREHHKAVETAPRERKLPHHPQNGC